MNSNAHQRMRTSIAGRTAILTPSNHIRWEGGKVVHIQDSTIERHQNKGKFKNKYRRLILYEGGLKFDFGSIKIKLMEKLIRNIMLCLEYKSKTKMSKSK